MQKLLITGAAGNLGGLLAQYLKDDKIHLNLMTHKRDVAETLRRRDNVTIFKCDLANPESLTDCLAGVDTIVHFAGVLFMANPEKFLPVTNTIYFSNLLSKALKAGVKRIILISFPHVEGETSPDNPAKGILTGTPISAHAKTRLEEEKLLFDAGERHGIEAVSLRVGMVYGRGILMIDGAHWFAKHRILGIWRKPTHIHLISTPDFLECTKQAIVKDKVQGIYHVGDEGKQTLQEFLDESCRHWKCQKPVRMPVWLIMTVARLFELISFIFGVRSPLTRDFIRIGMVSYYGDTARMRNELLPDLKFKTFKEGIDS